MSHGAAVGPADRFEALVQASDKEHWDLRVNRQLVDQARTLSLVRCDHPRPCEHNHITGIVPGGIQDRSHVVMAGADQSRGPDAGEWCGPRAVGEHFAGGGLGVQANLAGRHEGRLRV